MSRKRTSRKKASNSGGGKFKRLLGWTVLIAIVFSAGLITGERLVRRENLAPLVSVTDQVAQPSDEADANGKDGHKAEEQEDEEPTFAFFDGLTRKDEVALSSTRKKAEKPAPKAKKPAPKPEKKTEPKAKEPAPKPEEKAEPAEEAPKKAEQAAARYTLQVAAHPDMESAKAHMDRLRKMGLEPHLVSAAIPGKGKFYRVRVGKFQSMDEARSFQGDLKRKNSLSTFVSPL
jgi:cell division septation protein DedD